MKIIEEEDRMRPSNGPASLFLTVKYSKVSGTESMNRYMRNAMGRASLSRFAQLLGEAAGLKQVGRKFFRALGITIMFMAGGSHIPFGQPFFSSCPGITVMFLAGGPRLC